MAKLRSGILGQLRGKVAGVVGSQWKDKNYIREYVRPANPNTAAQQTQRAKMSDVVAFCKPLVGSVFNAYTDRFQKSMSGFNRFIKTNISEFDGSPDYGALKLTEGKLSNVVPATFDYSTGTGLVQYTWAEAFGNNGAATDKVFSVIYDNTTGLWYYQDSEEDRDTEVKQYTLPTGLTATNLEAWIWCAKYSNTLVSMISDSVFQDVSAS